MTPSSTNANSNQNDPSQYPLEAISQGIQGAVAGEYRAPRQSHMGSANEGPADIIAKVSGAVQGGKREDDCPYFTNNEGIPFPDPQVTLVVIIADTKSITVLTAKRLEVFL